MKSLFPDICSEQVANSKSYYINLLDFKEVVDLGWYVQLCSKQDESIQIAFVQRDHDSVPAEFQELPRGVVVTLEVENADEIYTKAKTLGLEIVKAIENEVWGQRHFMTVDPNGLLLDIYNEIDPDPDFLRENNLLP